MQVLKGRLDACRLPEMIETFCRMYEFVVFGPMPWDLNYRLQYQTFVVDSERI